MQPPVEGRRGIFPGAQRAQQEEPVRLGIPRLARLQDQERPVEPLREQMAGLAVHVVHEAPGTRRGHPHHERVARSHRRASGPRHPAPAGDAVGPALQLEPVPVHAQRDVCPVVDHDFSRLAPGEHDRAPGETDGIGGRRLGAFLEDEAVGRLLPEYAVRLPMWSRSLLRGTSARGSYPFSGSTVTPTTWPPIRPASSGGLWAWWSSSPRSPGEGPSSPNVGRWIHDMHRIRWQWKVQFPGSPATHDTRIAVVGWSVHVTARGRSTGSSSSDPPV